MYEAIGKGVDEDAEAFNRLFEYLNLDVFQARSARDSCRFTHLPTQHTTCIVHLFSFWTVIHSNKIKGYPFY